MYEESHEVQHRRKTKLVSCRPINSIPLIFIEKLSSRFSSHPIKKGGFPTINRCLIFLSFKTDTLSPFINSN